MQLIKFLKNIQKCTLSASQYDIKLQEFLDKEQAHKYKSGDIVLHESYGELFIRRQITGWTKEYWFCYDCVNKQNEGFEIHESEILELVK